MVDADLIPLSCDLVYGDEWVHGPGNPIKGPSSVCLERAIATTFVRAGNNGAPPRAGATYEEPTVEHDARSGSREYSPSLRGAAVSRTAARRCRAGSAIRADAVASPAPPPLSDVLIVIAPCIPQGSFWRRRLRNCYGGFWSVSLEREKAGLLRVSDRSFTSTLFSVMHLIL